MRNISFMWDGKKLIRDKIAQTHDPLVCCYYEKSFEETVDAIEAALSYRGLTQDQIERYYERSLSGAEC